VVINYDVRRFRLYVSNKTEPNLLKVFGCKLKDLLRLYSKRTNFIKRLVSLSVSKLNPNFKFVIVDKHQHMHFFTFNTILV